MVLVWGRPLEVDRSARVERVNDPPESSECPVPESKHSSCPCPEKVEVFSAARIRVNGRISETPGFSHQEFDVLFLFFIYVDSLTVGF
ncbi:hypothetical protein TNCT_675931 [Trichonephila clavata]|uniref:Uncharacterized protein n=1 Tax=Trichonephila clavata TaxID=2740835 RepID=A0A8X6I8S5_TRICU|nr:hypothetical protein TNCT_675931 [Trichonephila clavata]